MRKQFHCLTEHFLCALFHNYQLLDKLAHDDALHRERLNNLFFSKDTLNYYGSLIYSLFFLRGIFHNLFQTFLGLYELWKTGRYKSYPPNTLVGLIARILALVPPWTRVYRVQRLVSQTGSEGGTLIQSIHSFVRVSRLMLSTFLMAMYIIFIQNC